MKNNRRVFTENGTQFIFNDKAFKSCVINAAKVRDTTQGKIMDDLSVKLDVSKDAVNNWLYGRNGVSDPEMIKKAAEYLQVDWTLLVKKLDRGITMFQLTERQKNAAKRIYDVLIWFLEEFSNTDGFNSWWLEFKEQGVHDPEDAIYERITQMQERVQLVINQEYFDLHDQDIYDAFCEFASEDLTNVYNGKVSYAYRFEADGENEPTVWQDYEKAMQRLNEIIEKIV